MKKITFFSLLLTTFGSLAQTGVQDNIIMGPGYANEVFYTLNNREKVAVPASSWHIAIETQTMSATVFSNPSNTKVYRYPNGKNSDFSIVDTVGMHNWNELFNYAGSYNGAFNRLGTNSMDYGWGSYNMTTHNVVGDSLYTLKIADTVIVLDLINKSAGTLNLRFARLGNTANPTSLSITGNNYASKNFIFVNLLTGQIVDNEVAGFDLWFRKYHDIYGQSGMNTVTGVLAAPGVQVAQVVVNAGEQAAHSDFQSSSFGTDNNIIGADWKSVDYTTFQWSVSDTTVYYVKKSNGDIFKLFPTAFTGQGTGVASFNISQVANAGITSAKETLVDLYPNPAKNNLTLVIDAQSSGIQIIIRNQMGQTVQTESINGQAGLNTVSLDIQTLTTGMYFVEVVQNGYTVVKSLVKQ